MSNPLDPKRPPSPFDPDIEHRVRGLRPQIELIGRDLGPTAIHALIRYIQTTLPLSSLVRERLLEVFSPEERMVFMRVYAEMRSEGRIECQLKDLLKLLAHRGLALDEPLRARVLACTDETQLDRWFDRALAANTIAEVFVEP